MPAAKQIRAPKIPGGMEPMDVAELDALDLDRCRLDACALAKQSGDRIRFDAVRVVGGTMSETKLTRLSWLDVLCERCDLSLIEWPDAQWSRVEFRDCRFAGGKVEGAELDEVRFVECQLDYASFSGTRFRRVAFERCHLREATFALADLAGTAFLECNLLGIDLSGAKLHGADVSTSALSEVRVGASDVRGLVVNREQAAVLSQLFGLVIRDE
jgi:uncharacterized protein YjbI with pentapeptide repeats